MSTINRAPFGLLGFLGIKNFGRNPTALGDTLAPVWDTQDLYLKTNAVFRRFQAAIGGVGFTFWLSCPQDRVWVIHEAGWYIENPVPAGERVDIAFAFYDSVNAFPVPLSTPVVTGPGVYGCDTYRDLLLQPGQQLGLFTTGSVGAAKQVSLTARLTELVV